MPGLAAAPLIPVVDDDAAVCDSLGLLLRTAGYDACGFGLAEALLADLPPGACCVIADVRMPSGMDGVALVQTLRRRRFPRPVILVSGQADVPLAVQGMKAGAADFIEKPYGTRRSSAP
jgi:two-component system response regulator FixJ